MLDLFLFPSHRTGFELSEAGISEIFHSKRCRKLQYTAYQAEIETDLMWSGMSRVGRRS
jgi:hypothetical protein